MSLAVADCLIYILIVLDCVRMKMYKLIKLSKTSRYLTILFVSRIYVVKLKDCYHAYQSICCLVV